MKSEVDAYLERPKRYENVDGTGEMFFGLMLLGFALAVGLESLLPTGAPRWAHAIASYAGLIPALGLGFWLRRFIKKRWTWRRTGYVAYRRDARWAIVFVSAALIAAAVVLALAFLTFADRVLVLAGQHGGVSVSQVVLWAIQPAVYAFWIFFTSREHLWKWLLLLVMVLGFVGIGLSVHGDYARVGWQVLLFFGLVWIGSGTGTLFSYIRHTERAESQVQ